MNVQSRAGCPIDLHPSNCIQSHRLPEITDVLHDITRILEASPPAPGVKFASATNFERSTSSNAWISEHHRPSGLPSYLVESPHQTVSNNVQTEQARFTFIFGQQNAEPVVVDRHEQFSPLLPQKRYLAPPPTGSPQNTLPSPETSPKQLPRNISLPPLLPKFASTINMSLKKDKHLDETSSHQQLPVSLEQIIIKTFQANDNQPLSIQDLLENVAIRMPKIHQAVLKTEIRKFLSYNKMFTKLPFRQLIAKNVREESQLWVYSPTLTLQNEEMGVAKEANIQNTVAQRSAGSDNELKFVLYTLDAPFDRKRKRSKSVVPKKSNDRMRKIAKFE